MIDVSNSEQASGWYRILPAPQPARRIAGDRSADWVVLGAGFTGVAAARRLAEHLPEARILLVESTRVGYGTSGRNSGFIIDIPHYTEGGDFEDARRIGRIVRAGKEQLRRLVERHRIDCEWREHGQVKAAVGDRGMRVLDDFCRDMDRMGEPYRRLDRDGTAAIVGSRHYCGAVFSPTVVLMQPVALVRGLAESLPANVEVFEDSPACAVRVGGGRVRIECENGTIDAGGLLLASNALTARLGFVRNRVFPLCLFASMTRPLDAAEQERMGGEPEWGLVPSSGFGTTLRRTPGNRILLRNGYRYSAHSRIEGRHRGKIDAMHRELLALRYPALSDVPFEHSWGGVIAVSANKAAVFGRLAPGVFASVGYNGIGVPRGTAQGALLADLAVGADSDLLRDAQALPTASQSLPDPLRGIGVRSYIAYMAWRNRSER